MRRYRQIFETMFLRFCICVVADICCNHASIQGDLHLHRSRPFWEIMRLRFFYLRRSKQVFETIYICVEPARCFICVVQGICLELFHMRRCWHLLRHCLPASIQTDFLSASTQADVWNYFDPRRSRRMFYLRRSRHIFETISIFVDPGRFLKYCDSNVWMSDHVGKIGGSGYMWLYTVGAASKCFYQSKSK